MADIESLLNRWQTAGVLDGRTVERIRQWELEQKRPAGLRWQGMVALILGALLLASGVVLFVSAHWDELGPAARLALVFGMVAVFHVGGGAMRETYHGMSTALHAVGTVSTGAAIALVGQIFHLEEHWPAAIGLWAVAALAGWVLLRDEAQETLGLLLFPAWLFSEIAYATDLHAGQGAYLGRFLFVWGVLYLTLFLGSKRKAAQGILFAAGAIAVVVGTGSMRTDGWGWSSSWSMTPWTITWAWGVIAALPLLIALLRFRRSLVPTGTAVGCAFVLPMCGRLGAGSLLAHVLAAGFAVFLIWWGVRQASRALVNFGILGFALAVAWFYFSDIFDKVGRSLGLIGMGALFLAGGWALERMRRTLLAGMDAPAPASAAVEREGEQ
jgi:uncharacterized membrane protein